MESMTRLYGMNGMCFSPGINHNSLFCGTTSEYFLHKGKCMVPAISISSTDFSVNEVVSHIWMDSILGILRSYTISVAK